MSKYVLLSDLEEAKEIMYGLDRGGVYCVRMTEVRALAKEDDLGEYSDKLWKKAYERGKAEALSAEGELTNEKAIAFLQDNGWLVEHDRIMTSGSAEGEYIKKEDVIKYIDEMPSELTEDGRRMVRQIRLKEFIADLPTYSFPKREKGECDDCKSPCIMYEKGMGCDKSGKENE